MRASFYIGFPYLPPHIGITAEGQLELEFLRLFHLGTQRHDLVLAETGATFRGDPGPYNISLGFFAKTRNPEEAMG